ncbi:hypothetical protein B0H11DRAFT_2364214, partial [Mycena galericulata]
MDMYGTAALMYAARDGRLEVVQTLLRHAARPDLGNANYWTSVQFALDHPRILWICEEAVRLHRWLETQISCHTECLPHATGSKLMPYSIFEDPPLLKKSTSVPPNAIIQSVLTSDIASLHTLLFSHFESPQVKKSPILVNLPDEKGWSSIHYCAAAHEPCIQIHDTLHCAGAVVILFTTHEGWTPLHCLVQSERKVKARPEFVSLHRFVTHIVRDLGAPLEACDKEGETCIHIAAEKGTCVETLRLLLACDSSGTVRELPNSRGKTKNGYTRHLSGFANALLCSLTAMEIRKAELRVAFEEDLNDIGSAPSLSRDTVGPPTSALQSTCMDDVSILENVDLSASVEQLLVTLDLASPCEIQD